MPVMTNALLGNAGRLASSDDAYVANLGLGAQYGFGNQLPFMDAATPLVLRPVVPIITHLPSMFNSEPAFLSVLKNMIERHARSIDNIDVQYQLEEATVSAGADGQTLAVPTNSRRVAVNPSMQFNEVIGNVVWNVFKTWITSIKDPDTQSSSLSSLLAGQGAIPPHVLSMFTMDILFIQFDSTMQPQNIIDAYFITQMWPSDTGPAGYTRSTFADSTLAERTIPFHGVLQHNRNTVQIGRNIAEALRLHTVDYNYAPPIAATIDSNISQYGLVQEVLQMDQTFGPING